MKFSHDSGRLLKSTAREGEWEDVSNPDRTYDYSDSWRFNILNGVVIAICPENPPQIFELGKSSYFRDFKVDHYG